MKHMLGGRDLPEVMVAANVQRAGWKHEIDLGIDVEEDCFHLCSSRIRSTSLVSAALNSKGRGATRFTDSAA